MTALIITYFSHSSGKNFVLLPPPPVQLTMPSLFGVVHGAGERGDRVEQDAVLEVLLGARDDGKLDVDARLHLVCTG